MSARSRLEEGSMSRRTEEGGRSLAADRRRPTARCRQCRPGRGWCQRWGLGRPPVPAYDAVLLLTLYASSRLREADRGGEGEQVSQVRHSGRGGWWWLAAVLLAAVPLAAAQRGDPLADLRRVWEQPSPDARPMMRWWWFGPAVTPEGLDRELQAMRDAGLGGGEVQPVYPLRPHPPGPAPV